MKTRIKKHRQDIPPTTKECPVQKVCNKLESVCLFSSCHSYALDEVLLETQIQHYHRQHCQKRTRHQHRIIRAELPVQAGKSCRQRRRINIRIRNQRPHQICVGKYRRKYRERCNRGLRKRKHNLRKRLPSGTPVQICRLRHLIRNPHIRLSQKECPERTDNTRKYQRKYGIRHPHLRNHLVLRNNENLSRISSAGQ